MILDNDAIWITTKLRFIRTLNSNSDYTQETLRLEENARLEVIIYEKHRTSRERKKNG